jgi:hypothetical protein
MSLTNKQIKAADPVPANDLGHPPQQQQQHPSDQQLRAIQDQNRMMMQMEDDFDGFSIDQ